MEHVRIDKFASVTVNLNLRKEVVISDSIESAVGNVCVVKALEEKRVYDRVELVSGRMAKISRGDVIAGALGERRALQGFVGVLPERIVKGDTLQILNLGGVIGKAVSFNRDYGPPLNVEVLGMIERDGKILNVKDGAKRTAEKLSKAFPLVVVSGTSMNSGKTEALSRIVQALAWQGRRICAGKVTGISALKDILNMEDHGAVKALSFLDFGYPSTVNTAEVPIIAKGIINELSRHAPEVIMLELGDGLFGDYGVKEFFNDRELMENLACNIVCAIDPVGAWGMAQAMGSWRIPIHLVSGPVTDNTVGTSYVKNELGLEGLNAIYQQDQLGRFVAEKIDGFQG
jgi:hypothetical protein